MVGDNTMSLSPFLFDILIKELTCAAILFIVDTIRAAEIEGSCDKQPADGDLRVLSSENTLLSASETRLNIRNRSSTPAIMFAGLRGVYAL